MPSNALKNICQETEFERIYNQYAKELHDYLYYRYGEQYNPNDKAQEAFIKLWENCAKVEPGSARAFLYRVANNMMLNEVKHQKVVLRYQKEKPRSHTNEDPEFLMEQDQYLKKYQQVLQSLPEEQRTAFLLNKVEGKRHKEIAEMLGVSRKVVEYRIYSAFDTLKSALDGFKIK